MLLKMILDNSQLLVCAEDLGYVPKVVPLVLEELGIGLVPYSPLGKGFLTGAEWNWSKVYTDYAEMIKNKKTIPNLVRGGLKEGIVKSSPYGAVVTAKAKEAAEKVRAKFMDGSMVVYKGPIKDNTGKMVVAEGKEYKQTDIWLESMDWLVEGGIGSTKG